MPNNAEACACEVYKDKGRNGLEAFISDALGSSLRYREAKVSCRREARAGASCLGRPRLTMGGSRCPRPWYATWLEAAVAGHLVWHVAGGGGGEVRSSEASEDTSELSSSSFRQHEWRVRQNELQELASDAVAESQGGRGRLASCGGDRVERLHSLTA